MTKDEAKDYIREWCPYDRQEEIIKALEQEPKTSWIPVTERLPEEAGFYMTTIDYGKHRVATEERYYYGQNLGWDDDNDNCVIAWMMPLPEPYKVESEKKDD